MYKTITVNDGVVTRTITSNEFMLLKETEGILNHYSVKVDNDKYVVDEAEYKKIKSKLEG